MHCPASTAERFGWMQEHSTAGLDGAGESLGKMHGNAKRREKDDLNNQSSCLFFGGCQPGYLRSVFPDRRAKGWRRAHLFPRYRDGPSARIGMVFLAQCL